jgi:hypothetical protein
MGAHDRGAQRGQDRGAGRRAGGGGDAGDRFGRAVDEPRDIRVDEVAVGVHTQRVLDVVGCPGVVAPGPGAFGEHAGRPGRFGPCGDRPAPGVRSRRSARRNVNNDGSGSSNGRRPAVRPGSGMPLGRGGGEAGEAASPAVVPDPVAVRARTTSSRWTAQPLPRRYAGNTRMSGVISNRSPQRAPGERAVAGVVVASASQRHTVRSDTPRQCAVVWTCTRVRRRSARSASRRRTAGARRAVDDTVSRTGSPGSVEDSPVVSSWGGRHLGPLFLPWCGGSAMGQGLGRREQAQVSRARSTAVSGARLRAE